MWKSIMRTFVSDSYERFFYEYAVISDEAEPNWRIFGSARDLFHFFGRKRAEILFSVETWRPIFD